MILIGTWYLVVTKNRNYFGTSSDVGVGVGSVLIWRKAKQIGIALTKVR